MNSLEVSDAASAAVQKTPHRVTLDSIHAKVLHEQFFWPEAAAHVTIVALTLTNGFVVVGKAGPADPENFDADLGRRFAREDALRQVWALEGYALRERLSGNTGWGAGQ